MSGLRKEVEDAQSPCSSPTVVVSKKREHGGRLVDVRDLHEASMTYTQPLPHIEDILVQQGWKVMHLLLDQKDDVYQVPLHEESTSVAVHPEAAGQGLFIDPRREGVP